MELHRPRTLLVGLAFLATVVLTALLASGSLDQAQATHSSSTVDRLAIDTAVGGNTATSIGALQTCVVVPSVGSTTTIDIVVGPVGIPSDRPLIGMGFALNYNPAVLNVSAENHNFLLASNPGSSIFAAGDESLGFPDTNGVFQESTADIGPLPSSAETGDGVLSRITLTAVGTGTSALTLTNVGLLDTLSETIPIVSTVSAFVIVGSGSCTDTDGDGVIDSSDLCPGTTAGAFVDINGCSNAQVDSDGDGICNSGAPSGGPSNCTGDDNCPNTVNPTQGDADLDGVGSACDLCPGTAPAAVDTNGCSQAQVDPDADGVCSPGAPSGGPGSCTGTDNCPNDANSGQQDADADGKGNACDACPGTAPAAQTDSNGCSAVQVDADQDGVCNPGASSTFCTGSDNCPNTANSSQVDSDGDGVGNVCDACPGTAPGATVDSSGCSQAQIDIDSDGICNPGVVSTLCTGTDNCPNDANASQSDADGDGVGDVCDVCPGTPLAAAVDSVGCSDGQVDADGDGACDPGAPSTGPSGCSGVDNCPNDANPGQQDFDSDGLGDACDPDADADGVADTGDLCPFTPIGQPVDVNGCSAGQVDTDQDGVCNPGAPSSFCTGTDLCPGTAPATPVDVNGCADAQVDADGDGVCDPSAPSAGPGACTGSDLCPSTAPATPVDANGCADAQVDTDGDGVCDPGVPSSGPGACTGSDLCPGTAPATPVDAAGCADAQVDTDGDGFCNPGAPSTGPSVCTGLDNCPNNANPTQADGDGDGVGDPCDLCPGTAAAAVVDPNGCANAQVDTDGDGICNPGAPSNGPGGCLLAADNCPTVANPTQVDSDGDGYGNACDACPSTTPLAAVDTNGCSATQADVDQDGVCNAGLISIFCTGSDLCPGTAAAAPVDANGCSNAQVDTDADGFCNPGAVSSGPSSCTGADNCPTNANPTQADGDSDGKGDACDACPGTAPGATVDANGCSAAQVDIDSDGICNPGVVSPSCTGSDNCPSTANGPAQAGNPLVGNQTDTDGDGLGNACDSDIDNDGLGNVPLDQCPLHPEDYNGFQDGDGCPDDIDGDGIMNSFDPCALTPEDLDGYQDNDGCPESDNDLDGICDAGQTSLGCTGSDLGYFAFPGVGPPLDCRNIAEDYDGFHDSDGCPEPDNDSDGFPDASDQCPATDFTAGPDGVADTGDEPLTTLGVPIQTKEDYDGITDADGCHDSPTDDYDSDGLTDEEEALIYDTDPVDPDTDDDTVLDGADNCKLAANPSQADSDGDGLGDACDLDTDGDGVSDDVDDCPGTAAGATVDANGCAAAQVDGDLDGICSPGVVSTLCIGNDNCPTVFNPTQADSDSDAVGNACDPDIDGDGVSNTSDNCLSVANADQSNIDGDGQGDACDDEEDGDGIFDLVDNCVRVFNPAQTDMDGDGIGDLCDPDVDGDGVCNPASAPSAPGCSGSDNCPITTNPGQEDSDGDSIGDACQDDDDNDGVPDADDNCPADANSSQTDSDNDGLGNACDPDDDNDTVLDTTDNCPVKANPDQANWDGDAFGDVCDDGDGDGFTDFAELHVGTDPADPCGADGWPAELWSQSTSVNTVNAQDFISFLAPDRRLDSSPGDAAFHQRWDLVPGPGLLGSHINAQDMNTLIAIFPPMLNGLRALDATCPYPP